MALIKMVNGVRVEMSPEEEAEFKAQLPKQDPLALSDEEASLENDFVRGHLGFLIEALSEELALAGSGRSQQQIASSLTNAVRQKFKSRREADAADRAQDRPLNQKP